MYQIRRVPIRIHGIIVALLRAQHDQRLLDGARDLFDSPQVSEKDKRKLERLICLLTEAQVLAASFLQE